MANLLESRACWARPNLWEKDQRRLRLSSVSLALVDGCVYVCMAALQTQQQLMSVLAGRTGPEIGHAQFGEPPNPQRDPPQLMQRQLLTAALEVLAARSSGAGSSVDTPRTLDEMMSCGPSRSSFSLGSETASPVRERWAG
eukprot:s3392_g6.t1